MVTNMSFDTFLIITSITVLIISLYSMFNILGKKMLLTIPGFFYIFFIVFIALGSPFFFLKKDAVNIDYFIAVHLVLILLPIGILLTNKFMKIDFKEVFNTYLDSPVIDRQPGGYFIVPFLFILFVTLGVTFLYYSKLEIIPINYLLSNLIDGFKTVELGKMREAATTTFELGKLHRYNIFMVQMLPFLVIIALFKSKISKNNFWGLIFFILTVFIIYRCISDLQKAPIVDFIILIFLAAWIFKGKINWMQVGVMITSIISILSIMYFYIMGVNQASFTKLITVIGKRLFITQTRALYYYFSLFPSSHDFLYGVSFPNPAGIFQFENFPLTKWIFINGMYNNSQIVGTANSAFIGEIYANFGFPIMVLSILLFSMVVQLVQIKFTLRPRTLLLTAFYTYFVFLAGQFAMTGVFIVIHLYLILFLFTAIIIVDGYTMLNGSIKK